MQQLSSTAEAARIDRVCDAGTSLDMTYGVWLDNNGGIGASADSFYEYLLKAYILFGRPAPHV